MLLLTGLSAGAQKKLEFENGKWVVVTDKAAKYPETFTVQSSVFDRYNGCTAIVQARSTGAQYMVEQVAFMHCYVLTTGETFSGKVLYHNFLASYNEVLLLREGKPVHYKIIQEYH
jgi:hypothetical protein